MIGLRRLLHVLHRREIQEVRRPVKLVVEALQGQECAVGRDAHKSANHGSFSALDGHGHVRRSAANMKSPKFACDAPKEYRPC